MFLHTKNRAPGVHSKHVRSCILMHLFKYVCQKDLLKPLWCKALFCEDSHSSCSPPLYLQALFWLFSHFVRNQNKSLFRSNPEVNDRETTHLDASTNHVCHQKNSISSFWFWFSSFLSLLFLWMTQTHLYTMTVLSILPTSAFFQRMGEGESARHEQGQANQGQCPENGSEAILI